MTTASQSSNRRTFIRRSLAVISTASLLHVVSDSELAFAQEMPPVDPASPQAMAFGYVHDATKVDTAKYPKRAGAEGAKQFCSNCQLLIQKGVTATGQSGEWGKCALLPMGAVNMNGWCNQWILKQG